MAPSSAEPPTGAGDAAARELKARTRQLQAVSELGLEALAQPELRSLADRVVAVVSAALDVEFVTIDELLDDDALIVRAAVGLGSVVEQGERVGAGRDSLAGYTLAAGQPVTADDLANDPRFSLRTSFVSAGVRAGIAVAIGLGQRAPWGVLIAATSGRRQFTEDDVAFMLGVANLLYAVVCLEHNDRELRRLADAVEQSSDAIVSIDSSYRVRHWNAGAERLFGLSAELALGSTIDEVNRRTGQPESATLNVKAGIERVLRSGQGYHHDVQRASGDASTLQITVDVTPWRVDGRIVGITNILTDVTERRRGEQATARLAAIVDASDDAIVGKTLSGQITSWNPAAERIYGYRSAEVVGEHISILVPDDRLAELEQIMAGVRDGGAVTHIETRRRCKDGRTIDVALTVSPVRSVTGEIVGGATVARDITERKRIERSRAQELQSLEEAQRLAKLGSWTRDAESGQATWSPQMYEIFGRDPAAGPAAGAELLDYVHPDDRERIAQAHAEAFARRADFELECRVHRGGGDIRHVRLLGYADPASPGGYLGTAQDVTDQHQAEADRAQMLAATVRAESANRAKSEFLARMSHELRTPLNSIMGFAQLMELEGLEPHQQEHIGMVLRAARHLLELINEVLDLARVETGRLSVSPEPVALLRAISAAVDLIKPLATERDVSLHVDAARLAADLHVSADSNRLNQVLLNLLSNAIKYNRTGGRVEISSPGTADGQVRIRIADTGIGIPADRLSALFEPFERLGAERTEVEGTGLGLALSKALVEAMGGTLEIEESSAEGSSFIIALRVTEFPSVGDGGMPTGARRGRPPTTASVAQGQVLYIEDNLTNLKLVQQILERYFSVELISAMQGTLGLDLARRHRPDVIILDLHLPDTTGFEVLRRLKAEESTSAIPVIVLSADASKGRASQALELGAIGYLTKPLDVDMFVNALARELQRARPDAGP
jgi:PAS domain S-box-containing protein